MATLTLTENEMVEREREAAERGMEELAQILKIDLGEDVPDWEGTSNIAARLFPLRSPSVSPK